MSEPRQDIWPQVTALDDPEHCLVLERKTESSHTTLPDLRAVAPWLVQGKSELRFSGRTGNVPEAASWLARGRPLRRHAGSAGCQRTAAAPG